MTKLQIDGVYFLANDNVLDWAIAFLESFRELEPDRPLALIPFDARTQKIERLSPSYRFEVLPQDLLSPWDSIGRALYPEGGSAAQAFRKFCCFQGIYERFAYFDADIVLREKLDFVLDCIVDPTADLAYTDCDLAQVYSDDVFRERMRKEYGSVGINTGFFVSRRGVLTREEIVSLAQQGQSVKAFFASTLEQPFFNYCIDCKRVTLSPILKQGAPPISWANAGVPLPEVEERGSDAKEWAAFIHWAGITLSPGMPQYLLWLRYRSPDAGALQRLAIRGRLYGRQGYRALRTAAGRLLRTLRKPGRS